MVTERIKVVDVELGAPLQPLSDLEGYRWLKALVCLHSTPIGYVELPLPEGGLAARDLRRVIVRRLWPQIMHHHLRDLLEDPLPPGGLDSEALLNVPHPAPRGAQPLVTVAVCTRDRAEDLKLCLDSLASLDYPHLDVVVVDNAPSSEDTERLVRGSYPWVSYVCEPKPGLDWARNRAIAEARGEIIAYTDDDVVVDPGWVAGLVRAFEDPQIMAVTGLVVAYELETEAQIVFEQGYGGFDRGFERRYWRIDAESGERLLWYLNGGQYGTGANMAYRHDVFERIGLFDPALDVGTVTNGGGDLEMFFRVLKEGYMLAYEPTAMVRHRHRRDYVRLRTQITNNGIGFASYLVRVALAYPEARGDVARFWLWWFRRWMLRRLIGSFVRPSRLPRQPFVRPSLLPRELILAELRGFLVGLGRYPKARRRAALIAAFRDKALFLSADG